LKGDIKIYESKKLGGKIAIGQLELWDSGKVVKENLELIEKVMGSASGETGEDAVDKWFLTAPSISQSANYLYTNDLEIKGWLENNIGATFASEAEIGNTTHLKIGGFIGKTGRVWMRKEIIALL